MASVERIQAATGGINYEASPDYLAANEAVTVENLLPGRPGKLALRMPLAADPTVFGASLPITTQKAWTYGDKVLIATDGGSHYHFTATSTAPITPTSFSPSATVTGSRHARVLDAVYGQVDSGTSGVAALGKWDPAGNTVVKQATAAPVGYVDVKQHLDRLWVLGGSVPGTTTPIKPLSLYWSDQGGPTSDALTSWQDDVSGLTNQIVVAGLDTPVGLARCVRSMAIVMRRSIYMLTGTGSSSFAVNLLSSEFGCVNVSTIVEEDDGFHFLSDRGMCFCDGTTVRLVSQPVNSFMMAVAAVASIDTQSVCPMLNGFLAVCSSSAGTHLLHIPSGAWTKFSLSAGTVYWMMRTSSKVLVSDGVSLYDGTLTTLPAGTEPSDGDTMPIHATWTSRLARLASPGSKSFVQRVIFDYKFNETTPNAIVDGWKITVLDGQGNVLLPEATPTTAVDEFYRKRYVLDVNAEANEVQLKVEFNPSQLALPLVLAAELYDAWIEFAPAQNRSSM